MKNIINAFPGYEYVYLEEDGKYHNMYRGTDLGKGGYVYAEPGMYGNVALLDVASMHPHSILAMNCFGDYTKNYKDLIDARIAIKHGNFDKAKEMFGGKLTKYLQNKDDAEVLSKALKLPINGTYGLTSANFSNPFRDERNVNNIVALRGALFMRTLQDEIVKRGFKVVHCKTDSVKVPDATPEIIQFIMEFGEKYGYTFEHEDTYDKLCLVNNAVYIAKYKKPKIDKKTGKEIWWTATGKQFAVPYVFKSLFSKDPIVFKDLCEAFETKKGALYLDKNESLPDVSEFEKEFSKAEEKYRKGLLSDTTFETICSELNPKIAKGHDYHFVGRVGQFCPIKPGCGGAVLYRMQDNKYNAAAGTTGYRWLESEMVQKLEKESDIDHSYYRALVDDAVAEISKYGDFEWFVSDDPYVGPSFEMGEYMNKPVYDVDLPWK